MMRWATDTFDPFEWHSWFAWRPVQVDEQWVWLERIERRMQLDRADWHWELRLPMGPCPECGGPMSQDDGEPWQAPFFGCASCGYQIAVNRLTRQ
jgi:hypothetical protein